MSAFDVLSGIGSLVGIALKIYGAVKQVKSFKSQSKTIGNRVKIILLPVKELQKELEAKNIVLSTADIDELERALLGSDADGVGYDNHDRPKYIGALLGLKGCMENIETFLLKLGDTTWLEKLAHKKKIQADFDGYNDRLTTLQQSLILGLQGSFKKEVIEEMKKQLSGAFDKDAMERQKREDLKQEMESIKTDLEELKQGGKDQAQNSEELKQSLKVMYEMLEEEFGRLHEEIQFSERLRSKEEYVNELCMQYTEFTDQKPIQEGTYGPIIKAKHKFEDKMLVMKKFEDKGISSKRELKEQLNLWKKLRYSRFIVQLYGYTMDYESRMCFVVEFMLHGTLRSVLQDRENQPLPWGQRVTLARDCAQGLYAIHFGQGNKIMLHRAVTSTRFLVDERYRAKISDNGFVKSASKISKSLSTINSGGRGSVDLDEMNYLCPEEPGADYKRSIKSEVYKFGVILYEIASRMLPFEAMEADGIPLTHGQKLNFIKEGKAEDPPQDTPVAFRDLIRQCRQQNPNKRPATDAVVACLSKMY